MGWDDGVVFVWWLAGMSGLPLSSERRRLRWLWRWMSLIIIVFVQSLDWEAFFLMWFFHAVQLASTWWASCKKSWILLKIPWGIVSWDLFDFVHFDLQIPVCRIWMLLLFQLQSWVKSLNMQIRRRTIWRRRRFIVLIQSISTQNLLDLEQRLRRVRFKLLLLIHHKVILLSFFFHSSDSFRFHTLLVLIHNFKAQCLQAVEICLWMEVVSLWWVQQLAALSAYLHRFFVVIICYSCVQFGSVLLISFNRIEIKLVGITNTRISMLIYLVTYSVITECFQMTFQIAKLAWCAIWEDVIRSIYLFYAHIIFYL